ncbi:MAG TPA: TRAP transporter small permease [Ideonella sp.]|uniref:TRAP transporter small permease n=1 Tax=Ideonella sp. TaxID=1929293 RepID=UPI002E313D00|nr:TRAP transporter small permease [Ideonella sp.]HEX5685372.1 TRAP transporter small permease [Ideonella sp.]
MTGRTLRQLSLGFAVLGGGVACVVAAMTVTSIVMRALLSRPIAGDVELTQLGIALSISLCLPWAQLHGANIIVDFFTQRLPDRVNRRLDALGALMLAAMCALLSWRTSVGAIAVREAGETSMILGLPMWWAYASLAPGLALSGLIALVQAWRCWRGGPLVEN